MAETELDKLSQELASVFAKMLRQFTGKVERKHTDIRLPGQADESESIDAAAVEPALELPQAPQPQEQVTPTRIEQPQPFTDLQLPESAPETPRQAIEPSPGDVKPESFTTLKLPKEAAPEPAPEVKLEPSEQFRAFTPIELPEPQKPPIAKPSERLLGESEAPQPFMDLQIPVDRAPTPPPDVKAIPTPPIQETFTTLDLPEPLAEHPAPQVEVPEIIVSPGITAQFSRAPTFTKLEPPEPTPAPRNDIPRQEVAAPSPSVPLPPAVQDDTLYMDTSEQQPPPVAAPPIPVRQFTDVELPKIELPQPRPVPPMQDYRPVDLRRGFAADDPGAVSVQRYDQMAQSGGFDSSADMLYDLDVQRGQLEHDYRRSDYALKLRMLKDLNNSYRRVEDLERRNECSIEMITDVNT